MEFSSEAKAQPIVLNKGSVDADADIRYPFFSLFREMNDADVSLLKIRTALGSKAGFLALRGFDLN